MPKIKTFAGLNFSQNLNISSCRWWQHIVMAQVVDSFAVVIRSSSRAAGVGPNPPIETPINNNHKPFAS